MEQILNLLESNNVRLTTTVRLPGSDADAVREVNFVANFELIPQEEFEEIVSTQTKAEVLRRVLKGVTGIQPGKIKGPDGEEIELTPVEIAIRNPLTCDAFFTRYYLYINENGRQMMVSAAERKNSKRSRKL